MKDVKMEDYIIYVETTLRDIMNAKVGEALQNASSKTVVIEVNGTASDGYYKIETDFVPESGKTYTADFTCSSETTIPQGEDLALTLATMGGMPALKSSDDWWIQFNEVGGYGEFWCDYVYEDITFELTVYEE